MGRGIQQPPRAHQPELQPDKQTNITAARRLDRKSVGMLTSIKAIVDYGKDKPLWVASFVAVYLGNPLAFVGYLFISTGGSSFSQGKVLGITAFKSVSTNTTRMNPWLFVAVTFPVYLLWVLFNVWAIKAVNVCRDRSFDANNYVETYMHPPWAAAVAIPGLLNLLVWSTGGMEGNVIGFVFALPLLIVSVLYLAMWVYALFSSCFNVQQIQNQYNIMAAGLLQASMV